MGRLITSGNDIVWKYEFGEQASEMYRISEELGIGMHKFVRYEESDDPNVQGEFRWVEVDPRTDDFEGDVLVLTKNDVGRLDEKISELDQQSAFGRMVVAIRDYVASAGVDTVELRGEI